MLRTRQFLVAVPLSPSGDSDGATVVWDRVRRFVCAARNVSCQICARCAVPRGIDDGFCGGGKNRSAGIDPHDGEASFNPIACSVVLDRGEDEGSVVGVMTVAPRFLARWGRTGCRNSRDPTNYFDRR